MNASFIFNAGAEGSSSAFAKLKPGPKGEALSVYCDRDGKELAPSFVYGENDDGGRSAALAVQLPGNRTSSLFNLRKQELIRRTFSRLAGAGGLPIAIENAPGIWVLAAVSADGREMMVMANNLSGDVRNDLRFVVGGEWQGAVVSHVGQDGGCVPMGKASGVFAPGIAFEQMVPEFFLFVRPYEVQSGGSVRSPDGKPESVGSLVSHVS